MFLSWYNQIDKFLAYCIGAKKYIPFAEKVAIIAQGKYECTHFVKLYQNKLRYFGDLRNQIVHGFSLDHKHYVVASDHAVEDVAGVYEQLKTPLSVGETFATDVYTCRLGDSLKEVIVCMRRDLNTHVPVYDDDGKFVEMLSESTIAYRIADEIDHLGTLHIENALVGDVPLQNSNDTFVFVQAHKSIYEIEALFATNFSQNKRLGAVFITPTGKENEPMTGIVTAMDLPKLAKTVIL